MDLFSFFWYLQFSDGRIKPGDRILTINSIHTGQLTCEEAMKLIQSIRNCLTLTIEYNVANFGKLF